MSLSLTRTLPLSLHRPLLLYLLPPLVLPYSNMQAQDMRNPHPSEYVQHVQEGERYPLLVLPALSLLYVQTAHVSYTPSQGTYQVRTGRELCSLPQHSDGGCDVMLYVPFNNRTIAHCTYHNETSPRLHPIQCKNV